MACCERARSRALVSGLNREINRAIWAFRLGEIRRRVTRRLGVFITFLTRVTRLGVFRPVTLRLGAIFLMTVEKKN